MYSNTIRSLSKAFNLQAATLIEAHNHKVGFETLPQATFHLCPTSIFTFFKGLFTSCGEPLVCNSWCQKHISYFYSAPISFSRPADTCSIATVLGSRTLSFRRHQACGRGKPRT